jgi:RimJ/RimL family protein N-acetyltransferase
MLLQKSLTGRYVTLRSALESDAEFTYQIRQDKERAKYLHPVHGGIEAQRKWILEQQKREGDLFFVVENKQQKKIGTISLYHINETQAEAGRTIINGEFAQIAESHILLNDYAFEELHLQQIITSVLLGNKQVISFNKRLGAKEQYRVFNEEMGCEEIFFATDSSAYKVERKKIMSYLECM